MREKIFNKVFKEIPYFETSFIEISYPKLVTKTKS